jgi:hypothetical protein
MPETRALGVVLVRDRRTEQRHDPVAGELVDEAFKPFHTLRQDLEEAVHFVLRDLLPVIPH